MVSKFLKTSFLFGLIFSAFSAFGQPVQVNVAIAPPYPIHLEDYFQMKGQVIVTLVNTSQTFLQLRLVPSVKGQNGVSATLKPHYRPPTPLTLGPLETKVLTGSQLQSLNMGLSLENMDIKGVSVQQIIRTETLPEGMYDLCIRAFDFNSNTQLSHDGAGCSPFNVTWYDPPVVIQPANKASVQPLNPQFVNIGWTPSGLGGVTRYRLTLMNMTTNGLANPNDAFDMGFPPFFQKDNLITLGYPYGLAEPPLTVGHKYAVRVQAYDPQGKLKYKNDGRSEVTTFTYGGGGLPGGPGGIVNNDGGGVVDIPLGDFTTKPNPPQNILPDPNDPATCMSAGACQIAMPSNATSYQPKTGDTVLIGKFRMIITNIAGGTGEGTVFVNFLKTKVKVQFQNLEVNGQRQAYGNSKAWANIDQPNLVEQAMANDPTGMLNNVKVREINDYVNSAQKKVSKFTGEGGQPTGVPFALDNAKGQNLVMLGLIFTPTQAYANTVFGMAVQDALNNEWFQLGEKGICLRPNGFGIDAGKISLASNKSIPVSDKTSMVFKSGADNTFLSFDCNGITKVQLKGGLEFSRDLVLPLDAQSAVVAAPAKLSADFTVTVEHALNWMTSATLSHPKFALPQLTDIVFAAQNLLIDQSEVANVQGMTFPGNHPKFNKANNKDWKGVYLGTCSITLPSWMKGKSDAAISVIDLKDLLIDKTGLWVKVSKIGELVKIGDGSVAGWGFSIDTVKLDVQASQLAGGSLGGKLRLPVTKVGLGYSATITQGNPEANFSFSVKTQDEVTIDAFIAKATLQPNSWLKIEKKDGKYSPEAMLHGSITVGWEEENDENKPKNNNSVASFKLPKLNFSDFHIRNNNQGKPQILGLKVPFDNKNVPKDDQSKLAGFPLKLGGVEVKTQGQLRLAFGLDITLTKGDVGKNGLAGSVGFAILGKYDDAQKLFVYDRTELDSIRIDVDISVAKVVGSLWMYEGNETYGKGFKGSITATIKGVGTTVAVTLQVGNKGKGNANFDYFYFDGLVQFGAGVQIPGTTASIYGFGGGVWYNMARGALPQYSFDDFKKEAGNMSEPGSSPTGVSFTPQKGSFGFSAKVIFGLSGGKDAASALNGDLELRMYLSSKFGIDSMVLEGNGYAMQKIDDRGKAVVTGNFYMKFDFIMPSFTLNASLGVSLAGVITGTAHLNMHFSPQSWYINLGKWDTESQAAQDVPWDNDLKRCSLSVNLKVLKGGVKFVAYFMMGSKMPELPPLPLAIRTSLKGQNGESMQDSRPGFPAFDGNNPGFAFGVGSHAYFKVKALILYASLDFKLGFDVLLKKYDNSQICEGSSLGINNWYAQGQAYAQLGIGAGIEIDLFVWKGEWELFYVEATAYLYGSFPNPNYFRGTIAVRGEALGGLVKVDKSFNFETGKKPCINSSPFGDYPIVSDMNPRKMEGKMDKIQVYEDIHLAFNFPRGEFKVWNEYEPEKPARTCYYKIEKFSVKHGNKNIKFKPIEYTPDGYAARYVTDGEFFPSEATLKFTLEVRGYVKGENKQYPLEAYAYDFQTGKRPNKIVVADLEKTNPLPKQRFFLKTDASAGGGFVQWKSGQAQKQKYLFENNDDDGGLYDLSKTKFYVCFTELKTNKRIYRDFSYKPNEDRLTFNIPNELKNSTIYSMQVVKEFTTFPKPAKEEEDLGGGGGWGGGGQNENGEWEYESGNFTDAEWKKISQGAYRVNRLLKPDTSIHKVRVVLYELYFRTSKFNRMSDKMATYSIKGKGVFTEELKSNVVVRGGSDDKPTFSVNDKGTVVSENPILFMGGDENFDPYDAFGYTLVEGNFKITVPALVKFGASGSEKFPTWFYQRYSNLREKYDDGFRKHVEDNVRYPGEKMVPHSNPSFLELKGNTHWGDYKDFWSNSKYGSVQPYKPANLQVGLTAPVLTKGEIDAAKAEAPQQGNGNINNLIINVNAPGNGFQPPNLGLSAGQICIPVVDFSSALVARDYRLHMSYGWGWLRTYYNYSSQQSFLQEAYDYMQDYVAPRKGKTYGFTMGGKTFTYTY